MIRLRTHHPHYSFYRENDEEFSLLQIEEPVCVADHEDDRMALDS